MQSSAKGCSGAQQRIVLAPFGVERAQKQRSGGCFSPPLPALLAHLAAAIATSHTTWALVSPPPMRLRRRREGLHWGGRGTGTAT